MALNALNQRCDSLLVTKRQDLGDDLFSYLLEDCTISDEELRPNLAILFSAGYNTTSGSLSTVMYHLAENPNIQSTAREEVIRELGNPSNPTLKELGSLLYLTACIKEALRINPPISLLPAR